MYDSPWKFDGSFDYLGVTFLANNGSGIAVFLLTQIRKFYFAINPVLKYNYFDVLKS